MNYSEFLLYKETPCKFKLKSGKEVYGVIWEEAHDDKVEYLFASSSTHDQYRSRRPIAPKNEAIYRLSLEDVIFAEPLALAY